MGNSKRHTKPCIYFQTNSCPLSAEECDYAHTRATPEQAELLKSPQSTLRTKPCRYFLAGQCKDGFWCRFKHPANVASANLLPASTIQQGEKRTESVIGDDVDVRELRGAWKANPAQHPKYRTRPCRNFLLGKCVFGERCSYLHAAPSPSSSMCGAISHSPLSSPSTTGLSFPITAPATPPSLPQLSFTPPPMRVPNCTPVPEFELDESRLCGLVEPALLNHSDEKRPQTPSNTSASSQPTDWPPTPGSLPPTNGESCIERKVYPPHLPPSPVSPLFYANVLQNARGREDTDILVQTPLHLPSTPPYTLYSPISSAPVTIVHVPIAIPCIQSVSPDNRQNELSRLRMDQGKPTGSSRTEYFRTKPCRFFFQEGRCHKGDHCNFNHSLTPYSPSSSVPSIEDDPCRLAPNKRDEKPSNFYKINWRVLGGGVKMSGTHNISRRNSNDLSTPSYQSSNSTIEPEEVTPRTPENSSSSRSSRRSINALALNLRSSSLNSTKSRLTQPIIIVQDEDDESAGTPDVVQELPAKPSYVMRSKSSPPTPVSAHIELPTLLFSAESP